MDVNHGAYNANVLIKKATQTDCPSRLASLKRMMAVPIVFPSHKTGKTKNNSIKPADVNRNCINPLDVSKSNVRFQLIFITVQSINKANNWDNGETTSRSCNLFPFVIIFSLDGNKARRIGNKKARQCAQAIQHQISGTCIDAVKSCKLGQFKKKEG